MRTDLGKLSNKAAVKIASNKFNNSPQGYTVGKHYHSCKKSIDFVFFVLNALDLHVGGFEAYKHTVELHFVATQNELKQGQQLIKDFFKVPHPQAFV